MISAGELSSPLFFSSGRSGFSTVRAPLSLHFTLQQSRWSMRGHPATSCCSQNMIYNINLVRSYFYSLDIVSTSYYNNTLHGNTEHLTSFLYICLAFFLGCYQIFCCANSSQNYRDVIRVVIKLIHLLQSLFIKRSCCDSRPQGVCVRTS